MCIGHVEPAMNAARFVWVNDSGMRVGETHQRAKLTDADVQMILELRDAGLSYRCIAAKFDDVPGGVSKSTVRDICRGITRAQIPARTKRCG